MDRSKIGNLILTLRKEKGFTQKELADRMNLSDRTISKWERGQGYPDISLLQDLSAIFGVHIEDILGGELTTNDTVFIINWYRIGKFHRHIHLCLYEKLRQAY